jgi:trehalose 6-phosphate phosphatase
LTTVPFEPRTPTGRWALQRLVADPSQALIALDFDGTLAPIVSDPAAATAHPQAAETLARLAAVVGHLVILTGRPAAVAVRLGGFESVAGLKRLVVLGQYGAERWEAGRGVVGIPAAPAGLSAARRELPSVLARADASGADIEDKGAALAVHVRRMTDPEGAMARLRDPLQRLARRCGLRLEPGRLVLELRPRGVDKGRALRSILTETGARTVAYAGDDLGDLAAYDAVEEVRAHGLAGLLLCAGSAEVSELAERADIVLDGPAAVVGWLRQLADRIAVTPQSPA